MSAVVIAAAYGGPEVLSIVVTPRARAAGIKLLGGAPGADPGTGVRLPARLDLAELAGAGTLRVFVARSYPLSRVADAHRESMTGHATGKLVLIP